MQLNEDKQEFLCSINCTSDCQITLDCPVELIIIAYRPILMSATWAIVRLAAYR